MEKCLSAAFVATLIFAVASIQCVKGETFYIVTTPGSPFCNGSGSEYGSGAMAGSGDGQQCLTLQQFVTKFISNELSSTNLTLEMEPGEHILDSNLTMTTVVSFAMMSETATVNCTSPNYRYFELYNLENVFISGITFIDCGWLRVFNTGHFRFENSSFREYDHGGRYSLELDSVTEIAIIGSTFVQSRYSGQLFVGNCSMIHIQECTFSHLTAFERVIYSLNSTTLIIDSSTFEKITLDEWNDRGTAVEIVNNKENVTITNCDFINNSIGNRSETQGLFSVDGHGSIVIYGNRFTQNTGRVLNIISVNETIIDQNSFVNNTGPGAALNINAKSVPLEISRNNFTRNIDGAINLLVSDSSVTVSNCTFSSNTKNENGGAAMTVYEHDDDYRYGSNELKISYSWFLNNSANINGSGGALHIRVDSPWSEVTINTSLFSNNQAPQAGAVYIDAAANCTFGIVMTAFDHNMATNGQAGAVTIEGEVQQLVFLLNSTFVSNTAPQSCAGAVYIGAADTLMMGSTFSYNLAQSCGALALNSGRIEVIESYFLSNRAVTNGGVICISADMNNVSISTGSFLFNHAEGNGGVMIIEPPANEHYGNKSIHCMIDGSSYFDRNTAGSQGGVFATFARSDFFILSSSFYNSQAGIEGGVMYVKDTNSSVHILFDSQFNFNSAVNRGGVISINGSSLFIEDYQILNNSAAMGAVISACNSNVSIFPFGSLYQYNDPNSPNCLLYDIAKNQPTTAVTTPTIPPTRAYRHSSANIAVVIAVPIVCPLGLALIVAAALAFAYWKGYLKCKKSVSVGRHGVKKSETDDPDLAPLMGNA